PLTCTNATRALLRRSYDWLCHIKRALNRRDMARASETGKEPPALTHFSVVVCANSPDDLEQLLAPYDENREVAPWHDYEEGAPSSHPAVTELRKRAGLNPDDMTLTGEQVAG